MHDLGLMTTPQLHYAVYAAYRGMPHTEADYFARLALGFKALVAGPASSPPSTSPAAASDVATDIVVDCANGAGPGFKESPRRRVPLNSRNEVSNGCR